MCGHGTIALATALIETGAIPCVGVETPIGIDAPCGMVRATAHVDAAELAAYRTRFPANLDADTFEFT